MTYARGGRLGLIFPPSILGSAAVIGGPAQRSARPDSSIAPASWPVSSGTPSNLGHSGIVALVSDPGAVEIRNALALAEAEAESD